MSRATARNMIYVMLLTSAWFIALVLICLAGLVLAIFQLPGPWLILLGTFAYAWHGDFKQIDWRVLAIMTALALFAELFELLPSMMLARRAGASRRASWAALAGGFIGMFVFTLPMPVIGTIAGGIIGCFVGALAAELTVHDDVHGAMRVGFAAAVGRVIGIVGKLAVAMVMAVLAIAAAIR